jgi:hypothetical protein
MRNWSMRRKLELYPTLEKDLIDLDEKIEMERERLKAAYGVSSPILTDMPVGKGTPGDPCGSTVVNKVLPGIERLLSLENRRTDKAAAMEDVEAFLGGLDALERAVVELRYFKRLSWFDVCAIEHISIATAFRLHDSARAKCKVDSF